MRKYIYTLAIIEGAGLLVLELCTAKIVETQLGNSIYVWASVLAITLLGLAIGYYLGGKYSQKENNTKILSICFFVSGFFILTLPVYSRFIMQSLVDSSILLASMISSSLILLIPMIMNGMIGPLLVSQFNNEKNSGLATGNIYATSTFSSVINVLFAGIYLMPLIGISNLCYIYGVLMITGSIIGVFGKKLVKASLAIIVLVVTIAFKSNLDKDPNNKQKLFESTKMFSGVSMKGLKVLYETNGIFGTARVVDIIVELSPNQFGNIRGLMINNTWQTLNNNVNKVSMLDYVAVMTAITDAFPRLNNVLHIGLGGGQVSRLFYEQGKNVTAIEIDSRIEHIARKYFNLPKQVNVIIDDGRHFLNKSESKQDIIVVNAFQSGLPAWNLFTIEAFTKAYKLTKDDGLMVIEVGGNLNEKNDIIISSICKTIEASGWNLKIVRTKETENADYVCIGYKSQEPDLSKMTYKILNYSKNLKEMEVSRKDIFNQNQIILTDDKPILSKWVSDSINEKSKS